MAEIALESLREQKRLRRGWLLSVLLHPREAFSQITAQADSLWLPPLVAISLTALVNVYVVGHIRQTNAAMGEVQIPPELQYFTPEQQAQYVQAIQATNGPVFVYVFPALKALILIWFGWMIVSGFIHLILTMLGGRGEIGSMVNVVAWSGLPYALRELVRAGAQQVTGQLIQTTGIAGFAPSDGANLSLFLFSLFAVIDIYVIWQTVLLVIGSHAASKLSLPRTLAGVLLVVLLALALQASLAYGSARFGNLKIIQPLEFNPQTDQTYVQGMNSFYTILQAVFGGVGAVALLVAAIGIANTMAMAILERTREIGLMKAVGATNKDVLSVFLGEAAGIGLIGGLGGVILGWSAGQVINVVVLVYMAGQSVQQGMPPSSVAVSTPTWLLGFALLFAVLIGLLSGIYPALQAATLIPAKALKYE